MKKNFNVGVVIIFCIIVIFFGKIVRHTVMNETLVKTGVGWYLVDNINSGNVHYGLTIKDSETNESDSSATMNASYIYSKINFLKLAETYYEYEILISIIWNFILLIIISKLKKTFNFFETIFIVLSVAVLNIFDFCLAKEPIQMLYFILMYLLLISNKSIKTKTIGSFLIYILCFLTYRNYYILMAGFFVFIYYLYKLLLSKIKKINKKHIFLILISIFICYYSFLYVIKIYDIASYNELLRVRLRTSSAASDMSALFNSTNLFIFTLDYIFMLIRMLIPLELIKLGPKYFIYIVYQIFITYIFIKNIIDINKINKMRRIALFIFIAFLMGSAAFEPDFGSWVRHEAVAIPIVFIIQNIKRIDNKETKI
ncbi:MAG: hypothetical protein IKF19_04290 [Bacilli bacterium]|nr:hypothetical protein [Bacilli bacterium]